MATGNSWLNTHYWLEVSSSAGLFCKRGAGPPPSRKLTDIPWQSPLFVVANSPLKYGSRLTFSPLTTAGARRPGTAMPTLGVVSKNAELATSEVYRVWRACSCGIQLTVSKNHSVDEKSDQLKLILWRVVFAKKSLCVVITHRYIGGSLGVCCRRSQHEQCV